MDEIPRATTPMLTQDPVAPRGKTLWNALARFGAQIVSMAIGLLATPYIIRELGVESYGVVGVINNMISFLAVVTTLLTSTVGRNLTFAIERKEYSTANIEISTAVYGLIGVLAIVFVPICASTFYIDRLILIPPNLIAKARLFSLCAVLAFGFSTLSGPLGAAMFVRNRLDLFSGASLARTVFFIAAIVVLFSTVSASLVSYGISMLAASVLLCAMHLKIHRHLLPSVVISPRWFRRTTLRDVVSLGGWMTLSQIGGLLFLQTDILIANRVLGPTAAGQWAAISVIPLQLRVLAGLVSGLFGPTLLAHAARADSRAFSTYLLSSIRLLSLFFALLVGVFCGSAREVLSIWLGKEYSSLTPVAVILTAYLVITLPGSPTGYALLALKKVRLPAVITSVFGIINMFVCVLFAREMGLSGIALSLCIMLVTLHAFVTPFYVSRACNISIWLFLREQWIAVSCCAVIMLVSYGVSFVIRPTSMVMLVTSLFLSTVLGMLVVLPVGVQALRRMSHLENGKD